MEPCKFKEGDSVVCIDNIGSTRLELNKVYTVKSIITKGAKYLITIKELADIKFRNYQPERFELFVDKNKEFKEMMFSNKRMLDF